MRRVLITGAAGFVGSHLAALIGSEADVVLHGTIRHEPAEKPDGRSSIDRSRRHAGNLTDAAFADEVVKNVKPDWVVHLAAQSSVTASWRDPAATLTNNLIAQLNVLESVVRHVPGARVLVVGSSEEYGRVRLEDLPLAEDAPFRPDSPYAVSKLAQDFMGLQYHLGRNLDVVRVRPFNLVGPGQADQFVVPSFARQIAEAETGRRPPVIEVGNLEARRDFTDVRDAVRAYRLVLERGTAGEVYNVGGGTVRSVRDLLDCLCAMARCPLEIKIDPARFRPSDAPIIQCDNRRIQHELGWVPEIPIERTLGDILDEWRRRVAGG